LRCIAYRVARIGEIFEQRKDALRYVEPDRVRGAARCAGIIGHQHGDALLLAGKRAKAPPRRDAIGHHGDAVRFGAAAEGGEAERSVSRQRVLESERAGEHAAVEFRQDDMHGEIGGTEPARVLLPGRAPRGGNHRLQDRDVNPVES
jgi:hypothetical protein